jgi:tRNA(Ile)-lysidine synthase TilS/MesJ
MTVLTCSRCVLPVTFPGAVLDAQGVCSYCLEFTGLEVLETKHTEILRKFETLLAAARGRGSYDVLMCYSGGKDSTYTLGLLRERYDVRMLAVTVDNGFLPAQTLRNLPRIVERFGVDHILFKPDFQTLKRIFGACADRSLYPAKTLERASAICTACMGIVKAVALRLALEKDIPFIAFGWSPGQAPMTSALMKNNPQMVRMMQKVIYDPLHEVAGDAVRPYFLEERHFAEGERFPFNVHPLAFWSYREEEVLSTIRDWGWETPPDTDPNSTNCLLNSLGNAVHKRRFGYNPYVFELAKLVREGHMTRDAALAKLAVSEDPGVVSAVRRRLDLP